MLAARLAGAALADCAASERARGLLPPGELAAPILPRSPRRSRSWSRAGWSGIEPASLDVNVFCPAPPRSSARSPTSGATPSTRSPTPASARSHRLVAWARLLALSAAWPSRPFQAVTIGRARAGAPARPNGHRSPGSPPLGGDPASRETVAREHLGDPRRPVPPRHARAAAAVLQDLGRLGERRRQGEDRERPAAKAWQSEHGRPGEDKDAGHRLVLGGVVGFDRMLALAGSPRHDESGDGWDGSEATRFGRYARRLWDGLLDHEELTDQ